MKNQISDSDRRFIKRLESCHLEPGEFDHRAHIRAAYIYLCLAGLNFAASKTNPNRIENDNTAAITIILINKFF